MKPRNKKQAQIVERWQRHGLTKSDVVPAAVERWALRTLIQPLAMASGKKAWCTDCGADFPLDLSKTQHSGKGPRFVTCPHCGKRLTVTPTRKKSFYENNFFQQLDIDGEYQIIRMYEYQYSARSGRRSTCYIKHVYDLWLGENFCERWRFSVPMKMFYYNFQDPFGWGDLELRSDSCYYRGDPARGWIVRGIYPRRKLQPWLEKYDIRPPFIGQDIYDLVLLMMSGTEYETIWKLRRWDAKTCKFWLMHGYNTARFFRQLCLAHKHGYKIKDAQMWYDHLELLRGEKRDINNPTIIFPRDLKREHQILIDRRERRRQEEERRRAEERKIQEEKERLQRENANSSLNKAYTKRLGAALSICVKKGDIEIRALQNLQDFFEQGRDLHQCVYGSGYYKRKGSICLCVRVAGVRTETVEISVRDGQILQCRGTHNQDSPRHAEILDFAKSVRRKFLKAMPQPCSSS